MCFLRLVAPNPLSLPSMFSWLSMLAIKAQHIKNGIEMNLRLSKASLALRKVSHYVAELIANYREEDVFSSCEVMTTSAADAGMAGLSLPVMSCPAVEAETKVL